MTDFDARTAQWLSSLKLGRNTDYLTDFSNGYNFGAILEKFNLTRGKKFKDSHDMPCVFQNFKNTRDLLIDNFKVDFPIANIMNRTEELLTVIMGCCVKYAQEKKAEALKQASILGKVHN